MRPTVIDTYHRLVILKYVLVHALTTPKKTFVNDLFSRWDEDLCKGFDEELKNLTSQNIVLLKQMGLWKYVSPKEQSFLQTYGSNMDENAHLSASWRMEAVGMLMWALNMLNDWPRIDEKLNPELLGKVEIKKLGRFSKLLKLRSKEDISMKRDLIELWHWRVRTRQLIEQGRTLTPDEKMEVGFNSFDDIIRFCAKTTHEKGDLPEIADEDFVFLGKPFRDLNQEEYQEATSIIMERHFALNWLCGFAPGNRWDETPTDT